MVTSKKRVALVVLVSVVVLAVLGLVVGCTDIITRNSELELKSNETSMSLVISGDFISEEEFAHFMMLVTKSQSLVDQTEMLSIIENSFNEYALTRSSSQYTLALGFVASNWSLVDTGQRTPETLFGMSSLVFENHMSVQEATTIVNSTHSFSMGINNSSSGVILFWATCAICAGNAHKKGETCPVMDRFNQLA